MTVRTITHEQLDRRLDVLARRPNRFIQGAKKLAAELDAKGLHLDITDPQPWRGAASAARAAARITVENQLRPESDNIKLMGREEEVHLARRDESAPVRRHLALAQPGA